MALAHLHELVVDLLRRFDAVGRLLIGCSCGRGWRRCCSRGRGGVGLRQGLASVGAWVSGDFGTLLFFLAGGVGVGRRGVAVTSTEDELRRVTVLLAEEEHVAAGSIEQGGEDGTGSGRAVVAEDALVGDAAGDGHADLAGDIAEDLVKAGVIGCDGELTLAVRYDCAVRL